MIPTQPCKIRELAPAGHPNPRPGESELVARIRTTACDLLSAARGSHAWDHTLRVVKLCERIGQKEGADMTVLRIAALLHDIGRYREDQSRGQICHAKAGAEMAAEILADTDLSQQRKQNILHAISCHRFRGNDTPETLEAKALFDADKLDAIGAVGVARAFLFAGEVGARLHNPGADPEKTLAYSSDDTGYREYRLKLCRIKDRMLTAEGRRLAMDRHGFMEAFFRRFLEEYDARR